MSTSARPGRSRWNDTIRCHLTLWATLIVLAGVAAAVHPSTSLVGGSVFGQALVGAGNAWLLGTLPVLLAGGFAIATALRRTRLLVATGLVLGSTVVEVVGVLPIDGDLVARSDLRRVGRLARGRLADCPRLGAARAAAGATVAVRDRD